MAKFTFKSLFIKDTEEEKPIEPITQLVEDSSFPHTVDTPIYEKTPIPQTPPVPQEKVNHSQSEIPEEILNQVIEMYAKGFDSLNRAGYDFFEFFKSINAIQNPSREVYTMAFQMGKTMAPQITKQGLLTDADFYIKEVNGVHQKFQAQGEKKKEALMNDVLKEKEAIQKEIQQIEAQVNQLKEQILQLETQQIEKTAALAPLESRNLPEIQNIDQKLKANDYAMGIIVKQIENVKDGIQNNI